MTAVASDSTYAIELRDIVKRFPGVVANDGVDLRVRGGTIHAIVGENGAGKSTLVKTLYGAHRPDEGTITVEGSERSFHSPADAIDAGIGMVFQHFMLADNFTVWENVVLGSEPGSPIALDVRQSRKRIRQLGEQYGLEVDPDDLIAELGVGDKQRVEILKVLYRGAGILILDEPTAVLVPHEVDELFASLRQLTDEGATVDLHLPQARRGAQVRRRDHRHPGRAHGRRGRRPDRASARRDLAEMMVGSELPSPETRERTVRDEVRLEVRELTVEGTEQVVELMPGGGAEAAARVSQPTATVETVPTSHRPLDRVSFQVHAGEILGIAGVEGNGQTELIEAIMGLRSGTGEVLVDGDDISSGDTLDRRREGLGYIPEDRQRDGMVLGFPLWENVILGHQGGPPFVRSGLLDRRAARRRTTRIVDEFDVRTPGIDVAAFTLSGGNQQKLIVGREMTAEPRVLLAAHPTRGVDVGAQAGIWDILRDARAAGLATLLVSADLEELIGLSDRLLVMLRGRVVAELDPATVTPSELGSYMTGARTAEEDG